MPSEFVKNLKEVVERAVFANRALALGYDPVAAEEWVQRAGGSVKEARSKAIYAMIGGEDLPEAK